MQSSGSERKDKDVGEALRALTVIPELIRLYKSGRFPFDQLVRFYPFERINDAFADSARGEVIKPVLRITPTAGTQ